MEQKKKINVGVSEGYTTLISEDDNVKSETNFNYKLPIKKWDVVGNIIITINGKKTKRLCCTLLKMWKNMIIDLYLKK